MVRDDTLHWQGSLLGLDEDDARPDVGFSGLHRVRLDATAWVDVVAGWVGGADRLFQELLDGLEWRQHDLTIHGRTLPQPRLNAGWGLATEGWPEPMRRMVALLSQRYETSFDSVGANLYRNGGDSVAWHGDRILRTQPEAIVGLVSLGATRRFLLRPRGGGASTRFDLASGDLLVMGGSCQRTWQHGVPKTARPVGPRVSLSFRHRQYDLARRPGDDGGRVVDVSAVSS